MTTIGIASLIGSGVFFYLYFSSRPKDQSTVAIPMLSVVPTGNGGLVLGANGRF